MRTLIISLLLVSAPAVALAQTPLPRAGEATGDADTTAEAVQPVTEYDFEADVVDATFIRPREENVYAPQHRKTPSLIRVKANFVDELVVSADDV